MSKTTKGSLAHRMKEKVFRKKSGAILKCKMSPWFKPYKKSQDRMVTTMECFTSSQSGVYFIRRAGGSQVLYVGHSAGQLKKTMYRHFQSWYDPAQHRATYDKTGYVVRVIVCSRELAYNLEKFYLQKFKPRDAPQKYLEEEVPQYVGAPQISSGAVEDFGDIPF